MRPLFTMREALSSPKLFGNILSGDSWDAWRVILIAAMGEALKPAERVIFEQFTGRAQEPGQRVDEFVGIIGRRSGKAAHHRFSRPTSQAVVSTPDSLPANEVACFVSRRTASKLESCLVSSRASSMRCRCCPALITSRTAESLSLSNGIDIEVRSASFRGLRGVTTIGVIADEASFWYSDETGSKNTDAEILGAVRPSLATTGGPLIIISSPHGKSGEVYEAYRTNFGPNGDPRILVVNGATRDFNPSLPQAVVDRAIERDPELNKAEYLGQFRSDIANFIDREALDRSVIPGRHELQPQ